MAQSMSVYRQNGVDYTIDDPTVAPVFVESSAYAAGELVKHEGKLYRFKVAHAAGAWDSSEVTQVTVDSELLRVQSSVANVFKTDVDYSIGKYCYYNGTLYRFVEHHDAGDWDASEVTEVKVGTEFTAINNVNTDLKSAILHLGNVDDEIVANNLFPDMRYSENNIGSNITRSPIEYSGLNISGTLRHTDALYITRGTLNLDSTKKYTIMVDPGIYKAKNNYVNFVMRDMAHSKTVKENDTVVSFNANAGKPLVFKPDESYTNVCVMIAQVDPQYTSGMPMNDNYYIYLIEGEYDISYFASNKNLYDIFEDKYDYLREHLHQLSGLSWEVIDGNLFEDMRYSGAHIATNITRTPVEYSGLQLSGTLRYVDGVYITKSVLSLDSTKKYTLYIEPKVQKEKYVNIRFIMRDMANAKSVMQDGSVVMWNAKTTNNALVFQPDENYTNVCFMISQVDPEYEEGMPIDEVFYFYLVEGEYRTGDFTFMSAGQYEQLHQMSGLSNEVREKNVFEDCRYSGAHTAADITREPVEYSGLHLTGSLRYSDGVYITRATLQFEKGKNYTLYIDTPENKPQYSDMYFTLYDTTLIETIAEAGKAVRWDLTNKKAITFSPDKDYLNVCVRITQTSPAHTEGLTLDDYFYFYIVEGIYNTCDFVAPDNSFDPYIYKETAATTNLTVGLPIIELFGAMGGITKDDTITVDWKFKNDYGTCTLKWQGASSIGYTKKNFTIKLNKSIDLGWGAQKKYVLKASYIDATNCLNVCGAKLWSQIVANRGSNPAIEAAVNNGAIDGFPVIVTFNGQFYGLYTLNTPKDQWTFGMGSGENEYLVTAEQHSTATKFKGETELDGSDFELEYAPDGVTLDTVKASVNNMINSMINTTGNNWESDVNPYMDVDTAIDYMIFSALISNVDGVDKNFIMSTYDGTKWYLNAYDLDTIFGGVWTGGAYNSAKHTAADLEHMDSTSRLFHLIYRYSKAKLIARYNELKASVLSEDNVQMLLYNFSVRIPINVILADNEKWPLKPGTTTETIARIMDWYRLRIKYIDSEIEALDS